MSERSGRRQVAEFVLVVLAVGFQVVAYLYMTNSNFRYRVDVAIGQLVAWRRRQAWAARVRLLPGWAQEAIEQKHGRV